MESHHPLLYCILTCAIAPAPGSTPKTSLVDAGIVKDALHEKDKKSIVLKIKKPTPKQSIPGNWKESETISTSSRPPDAFLVVKVIGLTSE
jgi:hypothetical protein